MDSEVHSLRQIERLNQRGRRALSIVDLINDGTLTAEMAAFCWQAIRGGASLLTGAVPGGAGKTTLLAGLLSFLPPGERIVTVNDGSVIRAALVGELHPPATLLAHEIGSGHWFGYIWGRDAADFFRAARSGLRVVTCLHADTAQQAWGILAPLGVARGDFEAVRLQLFMQVVRDAGRLLRRVSCVCFELGGALRPVYEWHRDGDRFEALFGRDRLCRILAEAAATSSDDEDAAWRERQALLEALRRDAVFRYEDVRLRLLASA